MIKSDARRRVWLCLYKDCQNISVSTWSIQNRQAAIFYILGMIFARRDVVACSSCSTSLLARFWKGPGNLEAIRAVQVFEPHTSIPRPGERHLLFWDWAVCNYLTLCFAHRAPRVDVIKTNDLKTQLPSLRLLKCLSDAAVPSLSASLRSPWHEGYEGYEELLNQFYKTHSAECFLFFPYILCIHNRLLYSSFLIVYICIEADQVKWNNKDLFH